MRPFARSNRNVLQLSGTISLCVLALVAAMVFLREAKELLIPIVLAVIISYALEPLVAWLERHHVRRVIGTSVVLFGTLAAGAWGAVSLRDDVRSVAGTLPLAAERVRDIVLRQSRSEPTESVRKAAEVLQGNGDATSEPDRGGRRGTPRNPPGDPSSAPPVAAGLNATTVIQWGLRSMIALAGNALVMFFLIFFLLASGAHFQQRVVEIAGPDPARRHQAARIMHDINMQIQRFLLVRLTTAVIVGVLTWLVLVWMRVESAAMWGVAAGALNSIPYFGPIIVSGGLLVVGLLQQDGSATRALQISGAALAITSLEGWLLEPILFGRAERMSAVIVFLGLLLWTWLWGAWGTLLAVPMLVIIKSTADHVPWLRPVGRLMEP